MKQERKGRKSGFKNNNEVAKAEVTLAKISTSTLTQCIQYMYVRDIKQRQWMSYTVVQKPEFFFL